MNKVLPLVVFSILVLGGVQQVFADSLTSIKSGDFNDPLTWNLNKIPVNGDSVSINNGHIITVSQNNGVLESPILFIKEDGELRIEGDFASLGIIKGTIINHGKISIIGNQNSGQADLRLLDSMLVNHGTIITIGGNGDNGGIVFLFGNNEISNECNGEIILTGGDGVRSGAISNAASLFTEQIVNRGLMILIGGEGRNSGSIEVLSGVTLVNHNTIVENGGIGIDSGIIFITVGTFVEDPISCIIGGVIIPIEQISLIIAGVQTFSWMIPALVTGIGFLVVFRKL